MRREGGVATGQGAIGEVVTRQVEVQTAQWDKVVRVMQAGRDLAMVYND